MLALGHAHVDEVQQVHRERHGVDLAGEHLEGAVVDGHRGDVVAGDRPGGGASFTVYLPHPAFKAAPPE